MSIDDMEVVSNKHTSVSKIKGEKVKNDTKKIGIIVFIDNVFKIKYNSKIYDICFTYEYYPKIVFSTNENDYWIVGKPSYVTKPKLVSELTSFWYPVFEGMKVAISNFIAVPVKIANGIKTHDYIANIDTNHLEVKARLELQKWINKNALKYKPNEDSECSIEESICSE